MSKPFDKVIVALDHDHPDKAKALVDEVGSLIDWYKIGPVLFTRSGQELIRFLHERNKKIFLDLKLHDIPNVVAKTVEEVAEMGVQYLTIHSLGGRKMMEEASSACRGLPLKLLAVTMLTSHSTEEFNELGFQGDSESMVLHLQQMAMESRCAGIVLGARDQAYPSKRRSWIPAGYSRYPSEGSRSLSRRSKPCGDSGRGHRVGSRSNSGGASHHRCP